MFIVELLSHALHAPEPNDPLKVHLPQHDSVRISDIRLITWITGIFKEIKKIRNVSPLDAAYLDQCVFLFLFCFTFFLPSHGHLRDKVFSDSFIISQLRRIFSANFIYLSKLVFIVFYAFRYVSVIS